MQVFAALAARRAQRGVTLIEACIGLAVAGVLLGTAAPSFVASGERRMAEGLAGELAIDLRYVRSEAVARNEGVRVSYFSAVGGQCYLIHTGARSDCVCDGVGAPSCGGTAVLLKGVFQPADQPVKLVANVNTMLFNADSGTTVPGGTICVVPRSGKEVRHTVNIMGRVKTCTVPVGSGSCQACS
jgi:type IV fimbrial biogenesis protein FimT